MPDQLGPGPIERLQTQLDWLLAEKERLEKHVDAAFARVLADDLHGARVALTKARWGQR